MLLCYCILLYLYFGQDIQSLNPLQELDLHDILTYDAELGKTLQELQVLVCRKQHLESTSGDNSDAVADLRFRGAPIEDLCLDFTLPGYPEYILKSGDENVYNLHTLNISMFSMSFMIFFFLSQDMSDNTNFQVDSYNLEEYISLVVDATVKTGMMRQMEAFRAGFNQVKYLF